MVGVSVFWEPVPSIRSATQGMQGSFARNVLRAPTIRRAAKTKRFAKVHSM